MAKNRTTDVAAQIVPAPDHSPRERHADVLQTGSYGADSRAVQIEIPLTGQSPPTEFTFHVDCKLSPQQSTVARRIAQQLDFQNARLKNGQRIINVHGALKWLLEQIADQLA
jgi:hypothetical protein